MLCLLSAQSQTVKLIWVLLLMMIIVPQNIWRYLPVAAAWEVLEYQSLLPDGHGRPELHSQSCHGFLCLFRIFKE